MRRNTVKILNDDWFAFRLPPELKQALFQQAKDAGFKASKLVRVLIEDSIANITSETVQRALANRAWALGEDDD